MIRRICALLLGAAMLLGAAPAQSAGLDWAAGGYFSGLDSAYFSLSANIEELVPYGEDTVAMMNALLGHLSVSADASSAQTDVAFCVSGQPAATLTQVRTADGEELTTSLLPNRRLTSALSPMDALSGFEQQESSFDLFAAIEQAESCYRELTDAIKPYAEEKKANYNIKNVGGSRWSRIARLTPEQGAQLQPLVAKVLGCGMNQAFRDQLNAMELQKGFIVGLYQSEEGGDDLAVYIKGNVLFPDGAQRAISYQWAFAINDQNQRVDTYKFDMSKNKTPRDNRQISATLYRSADDETLLLDGQSKAAIRDPETNAVTTTTIDYGLHGQDGAVEGSWSRAVRVAQDETTQTQTLTVTPALRVARSGSSAVITGSAVVEMLEGKNTHARITLTFDQQAASGELAYERESAQFAVDERLPQSSLSQNMEQPSAAGKEASDDPDAYLVGKPPIGYAAYTAPQEETVVDLDAASDETLAALFDEMAQRLAGELLKAAAQLPSDALALIFDGLSEADIAALTNLLAQ